MSHNPHTSIICPNCGYEAQYNYCAQCGQATHLHKDTFWGLITHFVAHYFHYDSKFWKTIKTLWTKPGELTIAYRNKQRMQYIDPISLYIFVSAVFFLCFYTIMDNRPHKGLSLDARIHKRDSIVNSWGIPKVDHNDTLSLADIEDDDFGVGKRMYSTTEKMRHDPNFVATFVKALVHNIPKGVFFMIPFMALLLKLLFLRRKETYFVEHGIFSLHYHTFWFSMMLLAVICPFPVMRNILGNILLLAGAIYFVIAMKRVYQIGYGRAIAYSLITGIFYAIILLVVMIVGILITAYNIGAH